ncbi:MAG: hypothetical protein U0269_15640 [Polyangiales bacterium]
MSLRALTSLVALALLAACGTPSGPTDSSLPNNCGSSTGGARAAPAPCAPTLPVPGGCRNMLVTPVCSGGTYQCPAGTVNRIQCTCFDDQCEAGVDGGDASMDDVAPSDSASPADSAADAALGD